MTLLDLGRLLRRYIVLVIALPVVCLALCGGYLFIASSSQSSAPDNVSSRIVVNSQVAGVTGLASSEARQVMLESGRVNSDATVKGDSNMMTVTITVNVANGDYAGACDLANGIAERAVDNAKVFYAAASEKENMIPFAARVEAADPDVAMEATSKGGGKMKYLLVALLGGLFVAICIVVVIDMVRRPVKSIESVQEAVGLPVLEKLPVADQGQRLLANVRFASKKDDLGGICVVPAGAGKPADEACEALAAAAAEQGAPARVERLAPVPATAGGDAAAEASVQPPDDAAGLVITRCSSLSQGMDAAYIARRADAVLLTASQWTDSMKDLETSVAELRLADVNLVGIVFAPEVK